MFGVCNEKPEEPLTTVIIGQLDTEQTYLISKLMPLFGKVVSEPEEILFGEDEQTILSGVGPRNYKINVKINKDLQTC
jgi:hypothetical protein